MTEDTNPQNSQPPRAADQTQPEKPKRRKKAPPIDFNALDEGEQKLLQSIATTGAKVAGRQQKRQEGQLNAMKDTLADMFADPAQTDQRFVELVFKGLLANATPANAKKIASHTRCPSDLARAYRPDV